MKLGENKMQNDNSGYETKRKNSGEKDLTTLPDEKLRQEREEFEKEKITFEKEKMRFKAKEALMAEHLPTEMAEFIDCSDENNVHDFIKAIKKYLEENKKPIKFIGEKAEESSGIVGFTNEDYGIRGAMNLRR